MSDIEPLRQIVEDLIRAEHLQAKGLEGLVARIEQSIGHLTHTPEFGVVASELSELLLRTKKLAQPTVEDSA